MKTLVVILLLATAGLSAVNAQNGPQGDSAQIVPWNIDQVWLPYPGQVMFPPNYRGIEEHIAFANAESLMEDLDLAMVPVERYRFTWERAFNPKYSFYIYEAIAGNFVLRTTKYIGPRVDSRRFQGDIESVVSHEIESVVGLRKLIASTNFWSLRPGSNRAGLDGSTWTFEALVDGRYHAATRWTAKELEPLGLWIIALAKQEGALEDDRRKKPVEQDADNRSATAVKSKAQ